MNEATKLAIRERINTLTGELIELERTRYRGADPLNRTRHRTEYIEDEVEELNEDLDESEDDDEVGSVGTVYIDLKPRVDGFVDALKKLNED